ncbi:MAG: hypothetical protein ABI824_01245 [Acidobacteriota bacterium]
MHWVGTVLGVDATLRTTGSGDPGVVEKVLQLPWQLRGAFVLKAVFLLGLVGYELFFGYARFLQQSPTFDQRPYPLLNRSFHWISETPFNR